MVNRPSSMGSTGVPERRLLEEIVEAHPYVELGHKKGNVIVTVGPTRKAPTGQTSLPLGTVPPRS